ncbi:MAG: helix-turn-helix domain-containing protein [Lachnospiraceae bacterium]|nr:helix-turn-helix domain-containing protein [Lachnospiraceae bacterium]
MGEYSKSDIIRYYRKKSGMTQEELSEGICTPETLNRYENKSLNPTDDKFNLLMQKLGKRSDTVIFDMQTELVNFHKIRLIILKYFEQGDFERLTQLIDNIKEKEILNMNYPENQQFLLRIENIIAYQKKELPIKDYIKKLEDLLLLTFPEYTSINYETKKIYTENEFLIINNLATAYGKTGAFDIACNIFQKTAMSLEQISFNDYKPVYLLLINYANFLGINQKYDESIKVCRQGVEWLLKNDRANYLYNFFYNIGWNMIEKSKQNRDRQLKNTGKIYIWEAYQLCQIFAENQKAFERIKEYYISIQDEIS